MMMDNQPPVAWQEPISGVKERLWDCIIIGAGPAGSVAALSLAVAGHKVLLLDKDRFPRDKVCGDCLLADTISCLRRISLHDRVRKEAHSFPAIRIFSPSRYSFDIPGEYMVLRRNRFDTILAHEAVEQGAVFCQTEVTDLATLDNGDIAVTISEHDKPVRARCALIATGGNVTLARKLNVIDQPVPYAFAMRCYIRSTAVIEELVMTYDRSLLPGYGWIIPTGDSIYNVGCGTFYRDELKFLQDLHQVFHQLTHEFPLGRRLMKEGTILTKLKGAPLRCRLIGAHPKHPGNILLTGETIGTTYPFTGEGIGKAMETGELAAESIHRALTDNDMQLLNQYPAEINRLIRHRYKGYITAEKWVAKPWACDFLARRISRSKFLQKKFEGFVAKDGSSRRIYAAWCLLQSYWR